MMRMMRGKRIDKEGDCWSLFPVRHMKRKRGRLRTDKYILGGG
jgi:hypothetical protein